MKNTISQIIRQRGITQQKVASDAGIDRSYLNRIITGQIVPSVKTAKKIANVLGLKIDDIFLFDDSLSQNSPTIRRCAQI